MAPVVREKFTAEASSEALTRLRKIAESQGLQFDSVLDEALQDYIDRHQKEHPRRHVMDAFAASTGEFGTLYQELAK